MEGKPKLRKRPGSDLATTNVSVVRSYLRAAEGVEADWWDDASGDHDYRITPSRTVRASYEFLTESGGASEIRALLDSWHLAELLSQLPKASRLVITTVGWVVDPLTRTA
jgi:hypothetical protein